MMKHKKEILVALLAMVALFLLYFGFNFLKGVNIFNSSNTYVIKYPKMEGLVEQAPVYVKGYKVGQVDKIIYDFTTEESFTVVFSINDDICLPHGTIVRLAPDGLISGEALNLDIPVDPTAILYAAGDTLPTDITPGMIDGVMEALLVRFDPIIANADSIIAVLKNNFTDEQIASIMANVDGTLKNVNGLTAKVDGMMKKEVPQLVDTVKLAVNDLRAVTANVSNIDFRATMGRVDKAVDGVNNLVETVNSTDGTLGLLLNDKSLYNDINHTVNSADSLLVDLKAHPKRYVHFSLFGKKDK